MLFFMMFSIYLMFVLVINSKNYSVLNILLFLGLFFFLLTGIGKKEKIYRIVCVSGIFYLTDMLSKNRKIFFILTILSYLIFFFYWWCYLKYKREEKKTYIVLLTHFLEMSPLCDISFFSFFFSRTMVLTKKTGLVLL